MHEIQADQGRAVALRALPASVTGALGGFLPGSEVLATTGGVNDEERFYRAPTSHEGLVMRADITHSNRILDINTAK